MNGIYLRCIDPACATTRNIDVTDFACHKCGSLLDVAYDWDVVKPPSRLQDFHKRGPDPNDPLEVSGVWRFRRLLPFAERQHIVTIGEGQTILRQADTVADYAGMKRGNLFLQYEGLNPSGSFKDNGMSAAFTHARMVGATRAACASTGNTSASLALYAAATGVMQAVVFIGSGKIAFGKLAQALDHGALTIQIAGDFDRAMSQVLQLAPRIGMYLVNSVNPFRIEGQKTIMYRILAAMRWEAPDWIVVPGGNLGNVSAFGKAFHELRELNLIPRSPRLAVVNAEGARTFADVYKVHGVRWNGGRVPIQSIESYYENLRRKNQRAATVASAIEINQPVNLPKALRALEQCGGDVCTVTDDAILDAKAKVGAGGFGSEPASAAAVAGARKLCQEGVIAKTERVVCILTGHPLKDPNVTVNYHSAASQRAFANPPVAVADNEEEIIRVIAERNHGK